MPHAPSLQPPARVLLGPGPSNVHPRVLRAMSMPLVGHLDPAYLRIMDETRRLLQFVFHTRNDRNDGLGNGAQYSNAELDALIQQSATETDPAKLEAIYKRAHEILMFEDPAGLYAAEPQEEILLASSVKGHSWNPIHVKTFDFYALYRE